MLQLIINIILLIIGIIAYNSKDNKAWVVIVLYAFLSKLFGIYSYFELPEIIKSVDFALLLMIIMILRTDSIWVYRNSQCGRIIIGLLLVYSTYFIFTIFMGYESLSYAFKSVRFILFYLLYFPLQSLNQKDFNKAIRFLFIITVILGIRFLLQYVGIDILVSNDEIEIENGVRRFRNVPEFSIFFLMVFITNRVENKYKYFFLLFFLALLVLPMARMRVMVFGFVASIYLVFIRKEIGSYLKISLCAGIIAILLLPYLLARIEDKDSNVSMIEDITIAMNTKSFSSYDAEQSGTLGFRLAILLERYEFLEKHPQYLLTGVGFHHEDSPQTYLKYNFFVGTRYRDSFSGIGQVSSVDIQWVEILFQMGIIGVIIWIMFLYKINNVLYNNMDDVCCEVGFLVCLMFTIGSITEAIWTHNYSFTLLISLFLVNASKIKKTEYKPAAVIKL